MSITLYHPALKRTITVPTQKSADAHKEAGWTEEKPKARKSYEKKEA